MPRRLSGAPAAARVVGWDASLDRFGADTLNQRFAHRFGTGMTPVAWASWLAVKIVWEASLRAKSTDAAIIGRSLVRETTQFDGHKGRPLSFRPWDHQLRQPVYVRVGARWVEAPAANAAVGSAELLDRLGATRETSLCRSPL